MLKRLPSGKHAHRGLTLWYNIALVTFFVISVSITATMIQSGTVTSDLTKNVVEEAMSEARHGLEIVGKISGTADVANDEVITTATPVTVATGGKVDVSELMFKLNYKLIKIQSHVISYDNIYVGALTGTSYNSVYDAIEDAKSLGLIDVNPYADDEKPTTTSAFIYWVVNIEDDHFINQGELAVIAIVYADKDRPNSGEFLLVEGITPAGNVLSVERNIPNISNRVIDLGGKVSEEDLN